MADREAEVLAATTRHDIPEVICGRCKYRWRPYRPDSALRRGFRVCPRCGVRLYHPDSAVTMVPMRGGPSSGCGR